MISNADIESVISKAVSDGLQRFPVFMQIEIADNMIDQGGTGGETSKAPVFNTGKKLYKSSGKLFQSFIKGNKDNIYKASVRGSVASLVYGSNNKYAKVHEFGAFIKGTPVTILKTYSGRKYKRGKTTTKMSQYFWFKYSQTKAPFFMKLALAAQKNQGVNIPARPFFNPAIRQFNSTGKQRWVGEIKASILNGLSSALLKNRK
jgi:phage gpG-like protein